MKKTISIILSCLLVLTAFLPLVGAVDSSATQYPTIIVAGYSSSNLYLDGQQVWKLNGNDIISAVQHYLIGYCIGHLIPYSSAILSSPCHSRRCIE